MRHPFADACTVAAVSNQEPSSHPPTVSVVIPAHDEARVIESCLAFVRDLQPGEAEVVVVANGCTDDTARRARQVAGTRVVELAAGGKPGALNAGDDAATVFPRIYLDADIVLSASTVRRLRDALSGPEPLVAAPTVSFAVQGRPWAVRAFYRAYEQLPYVSEGLVGLGCYALSRAGRARFERFPDLTADDLYVQRSFGPAQRRTLADATFEVATPRSLAALLAVRTRTVYGNTELAAAAPADPAFAATAGGTGRALLDLVRRRRLSPAAAAVYVLVMLEARRRARGRHGGVWHRDASTR